MKNLAFLFTICLVFFTVNLQAVTKTAVVGASTWSAAADWIPAGVPLLADDVVIPNGSIMSLSSAQSCNSIEIQDGGSLSISGGITITITTDITLLGGSNFSAGDGNIIFAGIFTVERINSTNKTGIFTPGTSTVTWNGATTGTTATISSIGTDPYTALVNFYNLTMDPTIGTAQFVISNSGNFAGVAINNILTVKIGDIVTNGKLTLTAVSPTEFGRVALNDGVLPSVGSTVVYTGNIVGNITVEKVFHANSLTSAYPITGGAYLGKWFQMSFPLDVLVGSPSWTGITFNHAGVTGTPRNIYWWDASDAGGVAGIANGWTLATASSNSSNGYTVFLTSDGPFQTSSTISVSGLTNLNDVNNIQTPYTQDTKNPGGGPEASGWKLIQNPWPASVNVDELIFSGNTNFNLNYFGYHVYNTTAASKQNNSVVADQYNGIPGSSFGNTTPYVDYNGTGGWDAVGAGYATRKIHPFQAFWVRSNAATDGPVNLKAIYASTDIDVNSVYMKTHSALPPTAVVFAYDVDSLKDITLVYYRPQATKAFDLKGDIYKLRSSNSAVPTLFIDEAGSSAQSCGRPDLAVDTIVLNYASSKNNTTAYLFLNDTVLGSQYQVTLYDKVTQTTTNFNQNPSYMFTHNVNNPEDRFEMYITNNAISVGENNLTAKEVKVYLAGDELVVSSESYTGVANLNIFDLGGRLIISRQIELTEGVDLRVQMASMASSMYTIEITYNGKVFLDKLVK